MTPAGDRPGTFASLRIRDFRLYLVGTGVSMAGSWLTVIATSLLVYDTTDSGLALGIVATCQMLPVFVFSSIGGLIADRYDKRRALLCLQTAALVQSSALAWVATLDHPPFVALCVFAALRGSTATLDLPIRRSMVVDTVPPHLVTNAIALNSATMSSSLVFGATLGGALVSSVGYSLAFLADVATYVVAILTLWRVTSTHPPAHGRGAPQRGQMRASIASIRTTPELRVPLYLVALTGPAFNFAVVLPILVDEGFDRPTAAFTYLYAALSIGSVTGALLIARQSSVDLRLLARLALAFGVTTLCLAANPVFYLAFPIAVAVGMSGYSLLSGSLTVLQMNSDPAIRGSTVSFHSIASIGAWAVTAPIVGWLSAAAGPRVGIAATGVSCLAAAALGRVQITAAHDAEPDRMAQTGG